MNSPSPRLVECTTNLVELGVELVDGGKDDRLDGHRLDRCAELLCAVVRQDQVQKLGAERVGKSRQRAAGLVDHQRPQRDVSDKVALARVARGGLIVELLQLADVVHERADHDEVGVGAVEPRERAARFRHLQDVLEEAAPIRVVDGAGCRPDAQARLVGAHQILGKRAHVRVAEARDHLLQLGPHLVERTRRARHELVLAEALAPILRAGAEHHTANALDDELQPAVEALGAALHLHELAGVELVAESLDVVQDTPDDLARGVLQRQRDVVAAASRADGLLGAEEEPPTRLVGRQAVGGGEALHFLSLWVHGCMGPWG